MLDELPPYFRDAKSKPIGNSDLSVVTATALSNLLVAVGKDERTNVCVVITDLTATYADGSQKLIQALSDLDKETGRTAVSLEPVRMNTDEFYQILRRRVFSALPPPRPSPRLPRAMPSPSGRPGRWTSPTPRGADRGAHRRVLHLPPGHPRPLRPLQGEPELSADARPHPPHAHRRGQALEHRRRARTSATPPTAPTPRPAAAATRSPSPSPRT